MPFLSNAVNRLVGAIFSGYVKTFRKKKAEALWLEIQSRATKSTADFIEAEMGAAIFCRSRDELFAAVRGHVGPGQILEFGVFEGKTINALAALFPDRQIVGFDSFHGLPSEWAGNRYSKVNFDRKGAMPKVASNVKLIAGWFDESLPGFFAGESGPLALGHVDCDIYSSTVSVLSHASRCIVPGTVLVLDEFFNYPGYRQHEFKAWFEYVERRAISFEYIAYSGEQIAIKITAIGA
jgi:hypothetical protein